MNLEQSVKDALKTTPTLMELRKLLLQFKAAGGSQLEAKEILTRVLRDVMDSPHEDLIRDTLDIVVGWVDREYCVWDTTL